MLTRSRTTRLVEVPNCILNIRLRKYFTLKYFACLIFVGKSHRRKFFNDENFPIYGIGNDSGATSVSSGDIANGTTLMHTQMDVLLYTHIACSPILLYLLTCTFSGYTGVGEGDIGGPPLLYSSLLYF